MTSENCERSVMDLMGSRGGIDRAGMPAFFAPFAAVLEGLQREDDARVDRHGRLRHRHARLLTATVGAWEVVLESNGIDLDRRASVDMRGALYDDDMVMYTLCSSITMWNQLDEPRQRDHIDEQVARSLVRFLDMALALDRGADIHKRVTEALGNLLFSLDGLEDSMYDEAGTCAFSDGLASALRAIEARVATARAENARRS